MNGPRDDDVDPKTFMAWFEIIDEMMCGAQLDIKAVLKLRGQPIPRFAQDFLFDLLDPAGDIYETRLVPQKNGRAAQRSETAVKYMQIAFKIGAAVERGKSLTAAIDEVMGKNKTRQGRRVLKESTPLLERLLARFAEDPLFAEWAWSDSGCSYTSWLKARKWR
jgi:hypothetical protein